MFTQPNFFFIGGMRCGSTSLNLMLEQHPEIYMSPIKEPYYYLAQAFRNKENPSQEDLAFLENFEKAGKYRTSEAYQSLFQDVGGTKIVGESSHYLYHKDAISAIAADCSDPRILVCLRNPVDRLFSEYLLFLRNGSETGDFVSYVARFSEDFTNGVLKSKAEVPKLNKGLQAGLLEPWFAEFGSDRIKLIFFDEFNQKPVEIMEDIFRWLDIDAGFMPQKVHAQKGGAVKARWTLKAMNSQNFLSKQFKSLMPRSAKVKLRSLVFSKTVERPEMAAETRAFLAEFYREDVAALSEILSKDLTGWTAV